MSPPVNWRINAFPVLSNFDEKFVLCPIIVDFFNVLTSDCFRFFLQNRIVRAMLYLSLDSGGNCPMGENFTNDRRGIYGTRNQYFYC